MTPLYIAIAATLICFILYALDRRFRGEAIDWLSAAKITVLGGLLSGGIAFTMTPESVAEVVVKLPEIPVSQEMFVGQPTF
jgi:hypothetical protein